MAPDNSKLLILAGVGVGVWYLYEQGFLGQWFGASFAPAGSLPAVLPQLPSIPPGTGPSIPSAPITSTPVPLPPATTPPATPPTPAAPPPVTPPAVSIVGPVTQTINNGLQANVSINGQVQNISVIPSQGQAYGTSGHGINAQLIAQGVDIPTLISMFQVAYKGSGTSGISFGNRLPLGLIHGRAFGARPTRGMLR